MCFIQLKTAVLCVFFVFPCTALAQHNFVPNPGFDTLKSCPTVEFPNLENAVGWFSAINVAGVPGRTTLYNACAPSSSRLSVPNSRINNYQQALSGNGYCGLLVYAPYVVDNPLFAIEFAEAKLLAPLTKGHRYYLEFYTAPYFNTKVDASVRNTFIGSLGMAISTSLLNSYEVARGYLSLKPALQHAADQVIRDTSNWHRVNGMYVASGGESFAILGNFVHASQTYQETSPADLPATTAYYFFENVGIYEFDPLPDSIYLCSNEGLQIGSSFLDATYEWNTGSRDSQIVVSAPGIFYVDVRLGDVVMRDSVIVIAPASFPERIDTSVCAGGIPLELTPPVKGTYDWSTGSSDPTIRVGEAGTFNVNVTNRCGVFPFTWLVSETDCKCQFFVPNAFTPNRDGLNDLLKPLVSCRYSIVNVHFRLYNRWGQMIYVLSDLNERGWDGTFRGVPQPLGVYFWQFSYTLFREGRLVSEEAHGDCTLIR